MSGPPASLKLHDRDGRAGGFDVEYSGPWTSGLLAFLTALDENPGPAETAAILRRGPLASFGASGVLLSIVDGDELEIIAADGFTEAEIAPYRRQHLNTDLPRTRSVRENEVIITSADAIINEFPVLESDEALREHRESWAAFGAVVCAPIVLRGLAIGSFGFTCSENRSWHTLEIAALDALSAALGIWITHPDTPGVRPRITVDLTSPHTLTDRQRRILSLVRHGRSTASIAVELGVSVSTVKQDLARSIRELGASSRSDAAARAIAEGLLP